MPHVSSRSLRFVSSFACLFAFGCASSTEAPKTAHVESAATAAAPADADHAASKAEPKPAADADKPADPVITRTVADRVFAPRMAYTVNYSASGAKDVADQKCAKKFPAPEAKASCMEKERGKFTADILVFEKTDEGQWVTIYKRTGNALSQMSKSRITMGDDSTEQVSFTVEKDKGWRPLFAGKKRFAVKTRDEYSIQLDEPQYGNLVYEARIGLID